MRKSIIKVKNLTKEFSGTTAVDNISFEIEQGRITGLLGPNGAGKTTTIQMLMDVITPTSGTVKIFGKDIHKNREQILNQTSFSSAYVHLPYNLKVRENLTVFAMLYGVKNPKDKIEELADFFKIRPLLPKMTSSLSSGQLTRVNLTKALLNDPKLMLLDEPTASLDPDIADRVRKLLRKIQKSRGVTMLYTSHNMDEVEEVCDRVIFINKGKITDDGTPKALIKKYGRKDLNDVFLDITRGRRNHKKLVVSE